MLGFETIGNATIIIHDGVPVLVTDAWITDSAYFGSWGHSHAIPTEQLEAIKRCKFFWFSHGHPDHLNGESIPLFAGKKILLPNHVGGRIHGDLVKQGHDVYVMKDRTWLDLSENVKAMCISDYNQDAIILIDVGGRLLVNFNDAGDRGWGTFVKKTVAAYDKSFMLALSGYGDADMINFFDESGRRVLPPATLKRPVGEAIARKLEHYGCKYFVPSSSMHRYQREDSFWANDFTTPLEALATGFDSDRAELLPAFIRYNCETDTYDRINPASNALVSRPPGDFGDNWSDLLEHGELDEIKKYLTSIEHLFSFLDFVNFRVGGRDNIVPLAKNRFDRGITFEVPRGSLMTSVRYEIFDDLLIGNFMKTTLHGRWPKTGLYPDFSPFVAKYADNGLAKSREELRSYFKTYRERALVDYLRHSLEERTKSVFRSYVSPESEVYRFGRKMYWQLKTLR